MRNDGKGAGFGIFLLTVGIVWLLYIAKIVNLSTFYALFTLWPLILVAMGVGIIFRNSRIVKTVSWLVLLAIVITYGYFAAPVRGPVVIDNIFGSDNNITVTNAVETDVTIAKPAETEKVELSLNFGATLINLDSETANLLDARVTENLVQHSEKFRDNKRTASINFEMKGYNIKNLEFFNKLRQDFHLNKDVIWKLDLDMGAVDVNLDMKKLKIDELDIDTGASKVLLEMGSYNTKLSIDAGASKVDITLPEDTGMKIKLDGALNNTNLEGQGWVKRGEWSYSPEYDSKSFKIEADVNMGVGNLTIKER